MISVTRLGQSSPVRPGKHHGDDHEVEQQTGGRSPRHVLGGAGSAVFAAKFGGDANPLGIGFVGVALAFGLTVLTGDYALGHISGGHFIRR